MAPRRYQIVVAGELSRRFTWAFDGMTLQRERGNTTITGTVVDQAHLQGLLNRVGELGLELLSVATLDDDLGDQQRGRHSTADTATG
jgi:hypothetical protein